MLVHFVFLFWILHLNHACILCPLRIPIRPKPLDQFRLPSIQKILDTTESITRLCNNGTKLDYVNEDCRADVSHLFCSLTAFVDNYKRECPTGSENLEQCSQCRREIASVHEKNYWILTWIDSIGKMPSGISDGNYHWLGDYEQCRMLKNNGYFNGRYCLLEFQVPDAVWNVQCDHNDPLEVYLGICLPASCTLTETRYLVEYVADHKIRVQCEPPQQWPLGAQIFVFLTFLWLATILIATGLNWYQEESFDRSSKSQQILLALALQTNLRGALSTTRVHISEYHAIEGLQVVSLAFFIFGNLFFWIIPYLENVGYFYYLSELSIAQPIVNYTFHLDALLALAAMRLSLQNLNGKLSTTKKILIYFRGVFIKFWPAYFFIIGLVAVVYIRLGEGPMWSHIDLAERCSNSWWTNILLINNLMGYKENICLDAGFFIALEIQFLILALFAIFLSNVFGWKKIVSCVLCSITIVSLSYTFFVSFYFRTVGTLIPTSIPANPQAASSSDIEKYSKYVNGIYLNPLSRIAPFMLGLVLPEHFETTFLFSNPNISMIFMPIILILSLFIGIYVIWMPYFLPFYVQNLRIFSSLYCATHRLFWAFVILFLANVLNKAHKHNWLNAILSWRIFYPLSKLVYLALLVSEPVSLSLFASLHRPIYATPFFTILTTIGTLCCSFIIALLIDIGISRPINNLLPFFLSEKNL